MNPHENRARSEKVAKLLAALERQCVVDAETAPYLIPILSTWLPLEWRLLAEHAGCNPPSDATIAAVLEAVKARATAPDLHHVEP